MVCMNAFYDTDTSIRLKKTTTEKLKAVGKKGETYDDIINKNLMGKDIETRLLKELERLESKTDDAKVLKAINKIKELFKG